MKRKTSKARIRSRWFYVPRRDPQAPPRKQISYLLKLAKASWRSRRSAFGHCIALCIRLGKLITSASTTHGHSLNWPTSQTSNSGKFNSFNAPAKDICPNDNCARCQDHDVRKIGPWSLSLACKEKSHLIRWYLSSVLNVPPQVPSVRDPVWRSCTEHRFPTAMVLEDL
jgi:hypothetical protein